MTRVAIGVAVPAAHDFPPGLKYLLENQREFHESLVLDQLNKCSAARENCQACRFRGMCEAVFKRRIDDENDRTKGVKHVTRFIK